MQQQAGRSEILPVEEAGEHGLVISAVPVWFTHSLF